MNRTQKKCFVGSALMHATLVCVALFGAAFFSGERKDTLPLLDVIPSRLVDQAISGGGNPNVTTRPAPAPIQPPAPAVVQPPPPERKTVAQPKPEPEPEPPKPKLSKDSWSLPKTPKTTAKKTETTPEKSKTTKTAKTREELGLTKPKTRTTKTTTTKKSAQPADDGRRAAAVKEFARSVEGLAGSLSKGVGVEIPGVGGEAFASYIQAVFSIYDAAWIEPGDAQNDRASARASVVIRRDGTVESARIIKPSGDSALDRSVRAALERVTFVRPFPESSTDARRTFNINFNLQAKRLAG